MTTDLDPPDRPEDFGEEDDDDTESVLYLPDWYDITGSQPLVPTVRHQVEVWLRGVSHYPHIVRNSPYTRFAFTPSDLAVQKIDPYRFLRDLLPVHLDFEWLLISEDSVLWHDTYRMRTDVDYVPRRIPTYLPKSPPQVLYRLCDSGRYDRIAVGFFSREQPERDHRNFRILEFLHGTAAQYPDIKFMYMLGRTWRHLFGLNFAAVDYNPYATASYHRINSPGGHLISPGGYEKYLKWIHILGFSASDLKESLDARIQFNIASALWAAENFRNAEPISPTMGQRRKQDPLGLLAPRKNRAPGLRRPSIKQRFALPYLDPDRFPQTSPDLTEPYHKVQPVKSAPLQPVKPSHEIPNNFDKILCDHCSLAPRCRVFRQGAICIVATSPTSRLADAFGTRDPEIIKAALGEILSRQVERYERTASRFAEEDDSDVTDLRRANHLLKMETSLVRSTETLIKIIDPSYRESTTPSIMSSTTNIYNPRVLVADVIRRLEDSGIARENITPEIIQAALEAPIREQYAAQQSKILDQD